MSTIQAVQEAIEAGDLEVAQRRAQEVRDAPDAHPEVRAVAALAVAAAFHDKEMLAEAEVWGLRALQGACRVDVMCFLGEVAWERLDYESAVGWYEAACAIMREPVLAAPFAEGRQERLAELHEEVVERVRPVRMIDRNDEDHALVIQSLASRVGYREELMLSLEDAGVARWRGPKILMIDGKVTETLRGWSVFGTGEQAGQAQTYFQALRRALDVGAKRITFFEDDVVFAKNALDYIARVEPPDDAPLIAWWNRMSAPFRQGPPMYLLTPNSSFVRNVALSMSAETAKKLLDSEVVKNWSERHAGDMIYADALPGAKAALHFPGVVQHVGDESTVGKVEIRKSRSFIGKGADALRLFDAAPES